MSDFIAREPLHGEFMPMPGHDSREGHLVDALHIDADQTLVIRPAMDLKGEPVTDFDTFAERVAVFQEFAAEMPSAGFSAYFGPSGGVIVSEYVQGRVLSKSLHALRDEGVTKQLKTQVVKPTNDLVTSSIDYYKQRITNGEPMVIDVLKSDQYVVGPTATDKRPRPKLVDHDALIVKPTEGGEYDALNRIMFTEYVICHMASLSIFLAHVSRAPEVNNANLFDPTLHKVIDFIDWAGEQGMRPQATIALEGVNPFAAMRSALEDVLAYDGIENITGSMVGVVREALRDARIALQNR